MRERLSEGGRDAVLYRQTDIREFRNGGARAVVEGKALSWQKAFSVAVAGLSGFPFCGKDAYYRPSCCVPPKNINPDRQTH